MNFRRKLLPVYTVGAPILKVPAAPITVVTPELRETATKLVDTMFAYDGIGLAGPQAGIGLRMVALGLPLGRKENLSPGEAYLLPMMPMVVINPQIIAYGSERCIQEEGCLSVPEIYAPVERPATIVIKATILDGPDFTVECSGLLARCFQHELDHLDGKLFIQKTTPEEYEKIRPAVDALFQEGERNHFIRKRV